MVENSGVAGVAGNCGGGDRVAQRSFGGADRGEGGVSAHEYSGFDSDFTGCEKEGDSD